MKKSEKETKIKVDKKNKTKKKSEKNFFLPNPPHFSDTHVFYLIVH